MNQKDAAINDITGINDIDNIEALNRAWDSWNEQSFQRDANSDELADLFSELHAIDDAPAPDSTFLASLRADLVKPMPVLNTTSIHKSSLGLVASPTVISPFPRVTPMRLAYAGIAAVLLIAALVGGNRWLPGSGSVVMVASAMASPTSLDEPTATTYPASARIEESTTSSAQSETDLVIYPTAIPFSPENTTFGGTEIRAVRTPAIVYSVE